MIEDFRNEDVYQKTVDNYHNVFQELMQQRKYIDIDILPIVKKLLQDSKYFAYNKDLDKFKLDQEGRGLEFSQRFDKFTK